MTDLTQIALAQTGMVAALQAGDIADGLTVRNNEALLDDWGEVWLNVVRSPAPPKILDEVLGLGEDDVVVEYAQTFNLEWIVTREDDAKRELAFQQGLKAIETALHADRTLGGVARHLMIGPPDFENHRLAFMAKTSAGVIPVRVLLAGASPIG